MATTTRVTSSRDRSADSTAGAISPAVVSSATVAEPWATRRHVAITKTAAMTGRPIDSRLPAAWVSTDPPKRRATLEMIGRKTTNPASKKTGKPNSSKATSRASGAGARRTG